MLEQESSNLTVDQFIAINPSALNNCWGLVQGRSFCVGLTDCVADGVMTLEHRQMVVIGVTLVIRLARALGCISDTEDISWKNLLETWIAVTVAIAVILLLFYQREVSAREMGRCGIA